MSRIKFVKERVNGKKSMLMGLILAAVMIVSGISIFTTPTKGNGYVPPLVIYGRVIYQDGSPVAGAVVNLTDVTNGEWMVNITNATGYYSITFGGVGGTPWQEGDWLVGIATDGVNNGTNDTTMWNVSSMELNFVIDTPVTTKHIIGPHHSHPLYGDYYYIRLNTIFNFTAEDAHDGIEGIYYRIWYNGVWHPSPGTGVGKGNNFTLYTGNFTMGDFPWAGEGQYLIEFYSVDDNETIPGVEYTHKQWHDVDETYPLYEISYGCPTVNTSYGGLNYTMIRGCAPIYIHAYDTGICQSGVEWLNITGSYIGEWPGQTVEPRFDIHIRDGGDGDLDGEVNGEIIANVSFCEDSFHELDIIVTDYVGNRATYDIDLAVDYEVPSVTKTIVGPTYPGPHGNKTWLSCNTTIWLNATDAGCNGGAGVGALGFTIWWKENESSPTWNTTKYPPVVVPDNGAYNATLYDMDPANGSISVKFHFKEDCYHLLKAWAIDKVGNNNTLAVKNKHYVDCTPPWIKKWIPKIAFLVQDKDESSVMVNNYEGFWQEFIANWSYVDAINVSICGGFYGYDIHAELYDSSRTILLEKTESIMINDEYCGWLQLHLINRTYLEHGEHYWIKLVSGVDFYWNGTEANTNAWVGDSIVNGLINHTWDFAFKLEYYPIVAKEGGDVLMDVYNPSYLYSFYDVLTSWDGLNGTWITSKAFFNLASEDEGCMGGVGLESLQYRIWSNGSWTDWMNYTGPFNISDECKHYIEIRAIDHLGNMRIINQTHYVDNSPPTDIVDIPDRHGYYEYNGKRYVRAGYGIWINLTDMPECKVGLRNATLYWRYTYTNFTTPYIEEHPVNDSDYYGCYSIEYKNGKYWYVVPLTHQSPSAYISFERECLHTIYYFYEASDWLDNEITSDVKNISLYIDYNSPIAWPDYPSHYYNPIDDDSGYIRAGANFTIYAKDMPNPIPIVCIAQTQHDSDDTLQKGSNITDWPNDAQLFKAECDHINATKLYLYWNGPAKITVVIHNGSYNGSNALGEASYNLVGSGEGWIEFNFSPGIPVVEGDYYYLETFIGNESNAVVRWAYNSTDAYPDGYAFISTQVYNQTRDWAFWIITNDENPCASGAEGIYYGYYYNKTWYPEGPGKGVINISIYYDESEIDSAFHGHHYWYVINDSSSQDIDPRHGYIAGNISFDEECTHYFYYWTKDNVCHHSELYTHVFHVDDSSPEVDIEMPPCYSPVYTTVDKLDLVFVVDTSGSMDDEWNTLDSIMQGIIDNVTASGVNLSVTIYGLAYNRSSLPYGREMSIVWFNGTNITASDEDWGPGTAWAALWYPWREGAGRVIIPISDENAYRGEPETPEDLQSIQEAISACQNNSVVVFPFYGDGSSTSVISEMWQLANGTGGEVFYFGNASSVTQDLMTILQQAVIITRESISCNATMHVYAIDYPVTTGKIVDQEQTEANVYDGIENVTFTPLYTAQSFIPDVDILDAVQLLLDSGSGGTINVSIYDSGLNLIGYNQTPLPSLNEEWVQFHFNPSISLTPGETYWIAVRAWPSLNISWMWYNVSDAYPRGVMIRSGGIDTAHDFAFKTEYYGDVEGECSAGLEGIYYGYEYNGVWHPSSMDDNTSQHGTVVNISNYYTQDEIDSEFGGHTLWYIYDDALGITFTQECQHELYYWAKDNVCHHSMVYHKTLYVDNTPPEITKTHPSHGYEVVGGKPYLRAGANITIYADDLPDNNCSSGTWLYWRYVWNDSGVLVYYPFFYHEGFEDGWPDGWSGVTPWAMCNTEAKEGEWSMEIIPSDHTGWFWLNSTEIHLPDIPKIILTFWYKAGDLGNYDAANIFGINVSGEFIPLKFFYGDMSTDWEKIVIDLSPYAGENITLVWVYENDYGYGETWYIDDINITGWYGAYGYDNITVNISFNEECHHDLYYFASDTTCHNTTIYHQEYYVDGTAPETSIEVITNGYRPTPYYDEFDYVICINDSINLTTNNSGKEPCIYPYTQTYYRWVWIDENGTKHYYPEETDPNAINGSDLQVSSYGSEISPYYWLAYNGTFKFPQGCVHWLYFFSKDNLSNTEEPHNVTIGVDDEPPVTTMELEGISYSPDPNIVYIRNDTIIWLNATDMPNYPNCTTGVNYTLYAIWKYNYSKPGWDLLVPWRSTNDPVPPGVTVHVFDDGTSARRISIEINIRELVHPYIEQGIYDTDCGKYEIHWRSVDYNGLMEMEHDKDVIVDCTPPDSTKEFGSPNVPFYLQAELMHWISSATPIYINGSDDEVWDSGVAKVCIMYKKVDEIEYTKECQNGSKGVFYITGEDGKYRIFHWAVDHVGHAQDYNLTKQHVYLDNSPPESRVADIIPWNRSHVPFDITVTNITDHGPEVMGKEGVGVCKVEVYYRYSMDNATWSPWILYAVNTSLVTNPDGSVEDWILPFTAPNASGYYQFKSIAYDCLNNIEQPPFYYGDYDAWCYIIIDREPPIVNKTYGQPNIYKDLGGGEMGHVITSHTLIFLNATDMPDEANASGIDKIFWSFDGMTWYNTSSYNGAYTASYSFTPADAGLSEGTIYQIFVKATDMLGHMSSQIKQKFVVDDTPPESEANATCDGDTIYVTATAEDEIAGVENVELFMRYSTDGVNWSSWMSQGYGVYNASNDKWEWVLEGMDVGYYEFYTIATDKVGNVESPPPAADASCNIIAYPDWDVNMDGTVDILDMIIVAQHWMETPSSPNWYERADVNGDEVVNILDLIVVAQHFS